MRLFLSSYRFGTSLEALQELVGENAGEVTVITNAYDASPLRERQESVKSLFASFAEAEMTAHELDLRDYFNDETGLQTALSQYPLVWVAGGNTFVLARALQASGADDIIVHLVQEDVIAYGGESAGAIVATPALTGAEFADDPYILPEGYQDIDVWDGLGLVPYHIVPHFESDFEGIDRMIEILEEDGLTYKTLNDSQVLIVDGDETAVLG